MSRSATVIDRRYSHLHRRRVEAGLGTGKAAFLGETLNVMLFPAVCLLTGSLFCLLSILWMSVVTFRQSFWWLLGFWLLPLTPLVFVVKYWSEAKRPFLLYLAGVAAIVGGFFGAASKDPAAVEAVVASWKKGATPVLPGLTRFLPNAGTMEATRVANTGAGGSLAQELQNAGVGRFQDGRWQPAPAGALGSKKVFAFYYSAHWCPPCRAFTPNLVAFYRGFAAAHPEFELVFVSADHSEAEMRAYMQETGMPWPAVPFGKAGGVNLPRSVGRGIPCLVLADANGQVLSDSFSNPSTYLGPQKVLNDLSKFPAGGGGNPGSTLTATANPPPLANGETSAGLRRETAAVESAERHAALVAEKQTAYGKHRAEADALYMDLNVRRGKLKVDDTKLVATFNADATRYATLLEQVRVEKLALDELTFGASLMPPPESSKSEARNSKQIQSPKPEIKTSKL